MKRFPALFTAFVLIFQCLTAAGCASLFKKEYISVTEHIGETPDAPGDSAVEVSGFNDLRNAVTRFVVGHSETGRVEFRNYDGNVNTDLAKACWQVKSETAYGAYAVDYISYDVNHIVSYYAADVYINYRHTREELSKLTTAENTGIVRDHLKNCLEKADTVILIQTGNRLITTDGIKEMILDVYYGDPLVSPVLPDADVMAYPERGIQRIFETRLDYSRGREKLAEMKTRLFDTVSETAASISTEEPVIAAMEACLLLSGICEYVADGSIQPGPAGIDGETINLSTAYGALIENYANGEGFAMAYKALCDALSVECRVVSGRMDKAPHVWNIIRIDDDYYHVDVSQSAKFGMDGFFLNNDSDMWGRYLWDTEKNPECEGSFSYRDIIVWADLDEAAA